MKNYRKFTIGIIGTSLLSLGLYSCNNDDVVEQETYTDKHYASKGDEVKDFERYFVRIDNIYKKEFAFALLNSLKESKQLREIIKR